MSRNVLCFIFIGLHLKKKKMSEPYKQKKNYCRRLFTLILLCFEIESNNYGLILYVFFFIFILNIEVTLPNCICIFAKSKFQGQNIKFLQIVFAFTMIFFKSMHRNQKDLEFCVVFAFAIFYFANNQWKWSVWSRLKLWI